MDVVALQHVESSWTRDRTHVPCIGRWTQPLDHQGSPVTSTLANLGLLVSSTLFTHLMPTVLCSSFHTDAVCMKPSAAFFWAEYYAVGMPTPLVIAVPIHPSLSLSHETSRSAFMHRFQAQVRDSIGNSHFKN